MPWLEQGTLITVRQPSSDTGIGFRNCQEGRRAPFYQPSSRVTPVFCPCAASECGTFVRGVGEKLAFCFVLVLPVSLAPGVLDFCPKFVGYMPK